MAFTWSTPSLAGVVQACVWAEPLGLFVAVVNLGLTSTSAIYTSPDGETWTVRTTPNAHRWAALAYDGTTLVAVAGADSTGETTKIATSTDGITWTAHAVSAPQDKAYVSACSAGAGNFVVVADNYAIYSTDSGVTWSTASGYGNRNWSSVVYDSGHGAVVAVAAEYPQTTTSVMRSTDNGASWSSVTTTATIFDSYGASNWNIAYSPSLNRIAALHSTDAGTTQRDVFISDDGGASWTNYNLTTDVGDGAIWLTILWDETNGQFIAFSLDGGSLNLVATSADGQTWVTELGASGAWSASAYSPSLDVAVSFSLGGGNLVLLGVGVVAPTDDSVGPPTITMGPDQFVLGPPTRTLSTSASVEDAPDTAGSTYLWEFVSGPYEPSFTDPTALNIAVSFDHYDPGTFVFRLTATTIPLTFGTELSSSATMQFIIKPTGPPRISGGTVFVDYPECATLNPVVTDDGWGGSVGSPTYEFISGPTDPTVTITGFFDADIFDPNIFDCYSVRICGMLDQTAVYIFRVTYTREDLLSSSALWRIVVISDFNEEGVLNDGVVSLLVNGVEFEAQLMSTSISKNLNSQPQCSFKLYDSRIDPGNEVIIERGGKRLFGGLCISQGLTFDDETQPFYTPTLVGYAWHLHRTRVNKTYLDTSISDIAADLLTFSPRTILGTSIQPGLEGASIAFSGDFIDEALTKLAKVSNPPCHWFVDDFAVLHFAKVESANDPLPLTLLHPYFRQLTLNEDLSNVANRVIVQYNAMSTVPVEVDRDIQVDSLDGYNPGGGIARIGQNDITYTGTRTQQITFFRRVFPNVTMTLVDDIGSPGGWLEAYVLTYQTPYGETAPVWGSGSSTVVPVDKGVKLKLVQPLAAVDPDTTDVNKISAINIYRGFSSSTLPFVGSMTPKGGPGFTDGLTADDLPLPSPIDYTDTNGENVGFFLTGCNGTTTTSVVSTVQEDDLVAQADLAALLGGTDSGIIEVVIDGGDITEDAARQLALAYLSRVTALRKSASYVVRDDKTIPGQTADIVFPEYDFEETLTIQSTQLQGFEKGVFHEYQVNAAPDNVTLEDLLRHSTDLIKKK